MVLILGKPSTSAIRASLIGLKIKILKFLSLNSNLRLHITFPDFEISGIEIHYETFDKVLTFFSEL